MAARSATAGALAVLLCLVPAAVAETLSGSTYRLEVEPAVAASASGSTYRLCVGTACLAVPPSGTSTPPGNSPPGGGGGGGGPYFLEVLPPPPEPLATPAPPPPPAAPTTPATVSEPAFVPPLPAPTSAPASTPSLPWPLLAIAAAGTLALLLFAGARTWRVPTAAAGEEVAVAPSTEVIGSNCPFCGDLVKGVGLIVLCPACRAVHHAECWSQNRGCTTLGCTRGPPGPTEEEV